jgi:hypothetical protein
MTERTFRILQIRLDENEDVAGITAAVTGTATIAVIRDLLGDVPWRILSETESEIDLDTAQLLRLHRELGAISGTGLRLDHAYPVYLSLCRIVYGLIENG